MDATILLTAIIRPALMAMRLRSDEAERLLMGTAAQESNLLHTRQINGPALGLFQMEPATHDDCWTNYLDFHVLLAGKVLEIRTARGQVSPNEMITDHKYAAAMARVKYLRIEAPIPINDPLGIAKYWKQHYNSPQGAGTVAEFVENWNRYLSPHPYDPIEMLVASNKRRNIGTRSA